MHQRWRRLTRISLFFGEGFGPGTIGGYGTAALEPSRRTSAYHVFLKKQRLALRALQLVDCITFWTTWLATTRKNWDKYCRKKSKKSICHTYNTAFCYRILSSNAILLILLFVYNLKDLPFERQCHLHSEFRKRRKVKMNPLEIPWDKAYPRAAPGVTK